MDCGPSRRIGHSEVDSSSQQQQQQQQQPKISVFGQIDLLYRLKEHIDLIYRKINLQNDGIRRMQRFQRCLKNFFTENTSDNIEQQQQKLLGKYRKFDSDSRHWRRRCLRLKRKTPLIDLYSTLYEIMDGIISTDSSDQPEDTSICKQDQSMDESYFANNNQQIADERPSFESLNQFQVTIKGEVIDNSDNQEVFEDNSASIQTENFECSNHLYEYSSESPLPPTTEYRCDFVNCEFVSRSEPELSRHKLKNHFKRQYRCDVQGCQYQSKFSRCLFRHRYVEHSLQDYRCDSEGCQFVCNRPQDLKKHKLIHIYCGQFQCQFLGCQFVGNSSQDLEDHRSIHNRMKLFKCDHPDGCDYQTKYARCLTRHQLTHDSNPFRCDYAGCDFACNKSSNLDRHKRQHQINDAVQFRCDYVGCQFVCESIHKARKHRNTHSPQREHRCDQVGCDFVGARFSDLRQHRLTHFPEDVLRCDFEGCDFVTIGVSLLNSHRSSHTALRKYKCEFEGCSFASVRSNDLKHHRWTHNPATNFRCDSCGFQTNTPRNLKRHYHSCNSIPTTRKTRRRKCDPTTA